MFTVWKIGYLAANFSPASKDREDKRKMTTSRKPEPQEAPVYCRLAGLLVAIQEGSLREML